MTADNSAGAVAPMEIDWQALDWPAIQRQVRRLQVRIVNERLEPCEGRLSRTVLRGRGGQQ